MARQRQRSLWVGVSVCAVLIVLIGAGAFVWSRNGGAVTSSTTVPSTVAPSPQTSTTLATSLSAPAASVVDDGKFLAEVTEADPSLEKYEKKAGNVALRSLLTDGSAFCAFLQRDRNLDDAMVSVVVGARQVEPQTHLPMTVTTFNAVDAVAILTLCPSEEALLPSASLSKIRSLGSSLSP